MVPEEAMQSTLIFGGTGKCPAAGSSRWLAQVVALAEVRNLPQKENTIPVQSEHMGIRRVFNQMQQIVAKTATTGEIRHQAGVQAHVPQSVPPSPLHVLSYYVVCLRAAAHGF